MTSVEPKVIRAYGAWVGMICLTIVGVALLWKGQDNGLIASVIVGIATLGGVSLYKGNQQTTGG